MSSEHFQTACPNCQQPLRVRREFVGKRAACKHCGKPFVIAPPPAGDGDAAAIAGPSPEVAEELAGLKATVVRVEVENGQLREELKAAQSELLTSRAEVELLRQQLEAAHGLAGEVESLRGENERLAGLLARLEEERAAERQGFEADRGRLEEEARAVAAERDALREEVARLAAELAEQQAGRGRLAEDAEASRKALEERVEALLRDGEAERAAWAADRERLEGAIAEARGASEASEELRRKFDAAVALSDDLARQLDEAAADRDRARDALAAQAAELESLRGLVQQAVRFREEMKVFLGGLGIKLPS